MRRASSPSTSCLRRASEKLVHAHQGVKLAFMDITSGTNTRTMICVAHSGFAVWTTRPRYSRFRDGNVWKTLLFRLQHVDSLCFDFACQAEGRWRPS